jgi:hypothetical protein
VTATGTVSIVYDYTDFAGNNLVGQTFDITSATPFVYPNGAGKYTITSATSPVINGQENMAVTNNPIYIFSGYDAVTDPAKPAFGIKTPGEMAMVSELTGLVQTLNYYLRQSITMANNVVMASIGTEALPYNGTFDGRGFTIAASSV